MGHRACGCKARVYLFSSKDCHRQDMKEEAGNLVKSKLFVYIYIYIHYYLIRVYATPTVKLE